MTLKNRLAWVSGGTPKDTATACFGKDIEPRNLRICEHGATHVSLAGDWVGMAQGLHDLGNVLATTLNQAAILTQTGRFPMLQVCPGGRFAMNGCGGLGFDFAEWRRVWATRRKTDNGICRSLAIVDHDNAAAHHALLGDEASDEIFAGFARDFQGEPERRPRPARGGHECPGYHGRFQTRKWEFVQSPDNGAWQLDSSAMPVWFESVLEERIRLSTTIVSAPVIQSALWTPTALERSESQITMTASSTQLRLRLATVAEIWAVPLAADCGGGFAVEMYDAHDRLLLGVSAAPDHARIWATLLSNLPVR